MHRVRIFIPEKIARGGDIYVQKYRFSLYRRPTADPILVSITSSVVLSLRLPSVSIAVSNPFSKKLLLSYLSNAVATFGRGRVIITKVRSTSRNSWDLDFLAGNGAMRRG